jgi:hypothetical protein
MTSKRSQPYVFVDLNDNRNKKAYCDLCKEQYGMIRKLVPRLLNGVEDSDFRICCYCEKIYPINEMALASEYEPKATVIGSNTKSDPKVKIFSKRRVTGEEKDKSIDQFDIPLLAGEPDRELESMLNDSRPAILNSLSDSGENDD